jgi:glyoxylase-like metal-dependent hydrolase (beta-lactamase superfamily II)
VYVDKNDSGYWLSEEKANAAPSSKRTTFMQSRATVNPYVDAKKLKPFVGAQELFPGISSIPAYGHTAYLIGSRGKKLLLWGDVIHAGDVQFKDPDVTIAYDSDPVAAVKSRQHLFQLAATNAYLVGGAHISFPGLGHVASTSTGYEWVTAPYQIQGTL